MDPRESLAEFKRLLEAARSDPAASVVALTDALVGAEEGEDLRRCAIPHEFDPAVLLLLVPGISPEDAARRCEAFAELSIVQPSPGGYAIHDRWRRELFRWWLREDNRTEFIAASTSLTEHFERAARTGTGPAAEAASRKHMYHLLGADRPRGMTVFESLCRRARHQWRFAECAALIRLVHDYDDVLEPAERLTLAYHEGKLAADLREWSQAVQLFRGITQDAAAGLPLRVNGLVRLGNALRNAGSAKAAVASLEQAQSLAVSSSETRRLLWRVLQELGDAYRDSGELVGAEKTLEAGLQAAKEDVESADIAGLLNSLGIVYLRRRDAAEAVGVLKESLVHLARTGDLFRPAQVHNNLGLAYSEIGDWEQAEAAFRASLELKRQAGDVMGQGLALQNLSRALAGRGDLQAAVRAATEAANLFESQNDSRRSGIVKESLANYHRRLGDAGRARSFLEEALALLQASNDTAGAARVRNALQDLTGKSGLPWWAWLFIAIPIVLLVGLLIALVLFD